MDITEEEKAGPRSTHEQKKGKNEALFPAPSIHGKNEKGKHRDLGNFIYPTGIPSCMYTPILDKEAE